MGEFFSKLLDTSDFPARWHCGNWSDGHGWLHIASDVAVFLAYMAIPIVLAFFIIRRRDLPFPRIFWMFVAFIAFCGLSHLVEAYIFWNPIYRVSAVLKLFTAVASWATVAGLLRVMPRAVYWRSPEQLEREVEARTRELEDNRAELHRVNLDLTHANEDLQQFARFISHDLQSPLRAIGAFVDILRERLDDSMEQEDVEYAEHITGGVERMKALLQDLLLYTRTERTGRMEWIDLGSVTRSLVEGIQVASAGTSPTVEYGDLPRVFAHEVGIRQVLQNLVENAVKFSGSSPARIHISGRTTEEAWEIAVRDEGIGLDTRYAKRIFEPFQRLHLREEYEGTGIGLSIVRKIVQIHGGEIHVESSPGQGATFTFTIARPTDNDTSGGSA
ncbi:MAG: two-component sensor histidine kinase [Deltaproteobacteria bacterium]|nr:two-component sensor histidine kinase [Deltaproteobacteria bacterium]